MDLRNVHSALGVLFIQILMLQTKSTQQENSESVCSCSKRRPIGTNFGLLVRLVDVINCVKFYRNRFRGFDSVRGRSLTVPIGLRCRR